MVKLMGINPGPLDRTILCMFLFTFFLWESTANGILIYPMMKRMDFGKRRFTRLNLVPSVIGSWFLFVTALVLEWML